VILIDTGPLVALCDARDSMHRTAMKHVASLPPGPLMTCDAVLAEACFHLPYPSQRQRLHALVRELGIRAAPDSDDPLLWRDVFGWLLKYADHEPDWADGCLAVLSGRERGSKVWTYDREFKTIWRRPDGSAIPLAVRRR